MIWSIKFVNRKAKARFRNEGADEFTCETNESEP